MAVPIHHFLKTEKEAEAAQAENAAAQIDLQAEVKTVERRTIIVRADERGYWLEDEKFYEFILIETALRMWVQPTYVLKGRAREKQQRAAIKSVVERNSTELRRAADILVKWIEGGQLEIYDRRCAQPIAEKDRTRVLNALRACDPLARCKEYQNRYFEGRKLFDALNRVIPEKIQRRAAYGYYKQGLPSVFWKLKRAFGQKPEPLQHNIRRGDKANHHEQSRHVRRRMDRFALEIETAIQKANSSNWMRLLPELEKLIGNGCIEKIANGEIRWRNDAGAIQA
ncbi:MAG: hypothetical protein ACREBC_24450, partial [Pyrinomonadaceae bacterium]